MVQAIVFDVDDTLVDFARANAEGLRAHLRDVVPDLRDPAAALRSWDLIGRHYFEQYLSGQIGFTEQRRRRVRAFCTSLGLPLGQHDRDADRWIAGFVRHSDVALRPFPEVARVLSTLTARGLRLAVLSNSSHADQERKLKKVGLWPWFGALICCDDVDGLAKPDPRTFWTACRSVGVAPSRAAYVGDQLESDARAATRAGLQGIWLNRDGHEVADVPTIADLRGLLNDSLLSSDELQRTD